MASGYTWFSLNYFFSEIFNSKSNISTSFSILFLYCPIVALSIIILSRSEEVKAFRNCLTKFERLSFDGLLKFS